MTPMCSADTGKTVGWAIASVDCDGTAVSIRYYNVNGGLVGTTKPAAWEYCRPGFSNETIYSIVVISESDYAALVSPDPNTLYLVVPD